MRKKDFGLRQHHPRTSNAGPEAFGRLQGEKKTSDKLRWDFFLVVLFGDLLVGKPKNNLCHRTSTTSPDALPQIGKDELLAAPCSRSLCFFLGDPHSLKKNTQVHLIPLCKAVFNETRLARNIDLPTQLPVAILKSPVRRKKEALLFGICVPRYKK